jgi:hypothetical protein
MRLWVGELVGFSALGWLLAGILDAVGAFDLSDALVLSGLLLAVIAGLVALQGGDRPLIRVRTPPAVSMAVLTDQGPGVPPSGARALALVSAGVAPAGLIAAGVVVG